MSEMVWLHAISCPCQLCEYTRLDRAVMEIEQRRSLALREEVEAQRERKKRQEEIKRIWKNKTPEELAEHGRKTYASRRGLREIAQEL